MKTIQKGSEIKRFDDETADKKVRNENYAYVPKSAWKALHRETLVEAKIVSIEHKEKKNKKHKI